MSHRPSRLLTDALRELRKTISRFLSLFLLSALSVAFLAGLRTTAPAMEYTADVYFDQQNLMDLHILSTLGLMDADIEALSNQPGVQRAEGSYTVDALVHLEENDLIIKLLSLSPSGLNAPQLLEGRLPENDRECAVERALLTSAGLSLGDRLSFDTGDGSFQDALKQNTYTIVGIVNSPLYVYVERGSSSLGTGRVSAFALLPEGAFQLDTYTDAYLLAEGASALLCYSDEYDDWMDELTRQLEPLADTRAALRYDSVIGEVNATLAEAQTEFDRGESEANEQLAEAWNTLSDARTKLDNGWADYWSGKAALQRESIDAEQTIQEAEQALFDAKETLDNGEADYERGTKTFANGKLDYDEGLRVWQEGLVSYQDNYAKLQAAQQDYEAGLASYQEGLVALQTGAGQLSAAKKKLDGAKVQLDSGNAQLSDGLRQYSERKAQLDTLKASFDAGSPAFEAPALSAAVAGIAADDSGAMAASFFSQAVSPLREFLLAIQTQSDPSSQAYVQIAQLLVSIPSNAQALQDLSTSMPDALILALQSGAAAVASGLAAMDAQLSAAQAALDSSASALTSGHHDYVTGWAAYEEAKASFDQSVRTLQASKDMLSDAESELSTGWVALAHGKQTLDEGKKTLEDSALLLAAGEGDLILARAELDVGWTDYNHGLSNLDAAKRKVLEETATAQRTLSDARLELEQREAEYMDALHRYEEKSRETAQALSFARQDLSNAKRKVSEVASCQWYLLGRNTNAGYVSYQQDAERMGNLAHVFPLIFFLVAALVCLTTMTRMVEEQRVQIGGMKALGYSKGGIALKYVGYGFLASSLGGIAGLFFGCSFIPWVIFTAWTILYQVGDLMILVSPGISILSVGAAVLCVTGSAFAACFTALHASPAALMRPRSPKPGKRVLLERIPLLWRRLSFTWKVTVRNLFRYQRRFWMTVIGIGGCTALIVAGFGLRDSIYSILDKQFDEISPYSAQINLIDAITDRELAEITHVLNADSTVTNWHFTHTESLTAESPKRTMGITLFAVEDSAAFLDFIHLRHRSDGASVPIPQEGAVITEKLAELLGLSVGDVVTLSGEKRVALPVADIVENYVMHYVYVSAAFYEQLFGKTPSANAVLAYYADDAKATSDHISSQLITLTGVSSVNRIRETRDTFTKSMQSVDYAVIVIIVAAAALAFVVLYNLTNINITERMRELATLKVLGFYPKELSAYIYRENLFLTFLGVLLGLFAGKFLHQWLVLTVEIERVMFGRSAQPASYLFAVILTLLFSFLVNLTARKKFRTIDMVESLKTVE